MYNILISIVDQLAYILNLLLIVRVLLSWTGQNQFNPLVVQLYKITDPMLAPFRNIVPLRLGLDFSPIFAMLAVSLVKQLLIKLILSF